MPPEWVLGLFDIWFGLEFTHLPVDPFELTKVDFGKILRCYIRKVPDRQKMRPVFVSNKLPKQINKLAN